MMSSKRQGSDNQDSTDLGVIDADATAKKVLGPFAWLTSILKILPYVGYAKVINFQQAASKMTKGTDVLDWWSNDLSLNVTVEGLEHLPHDGPVIVYCNHPTGLGDGIAVWDAIKAKRPDLKIMMNAQGLDGIPVFKDLLVPVRLAKDGSSSGRRHTWKSLVNAMDDQGVVMVCPAGRLSQLDWFGDWDVHELPWRKGIVKMARDFPQAQMVPVFIEGRVRKHYYVLHRLLPFLRDILLYTEFQSKANWRYRVNILPPIAVTDAREAQAYVEGQKKHKWFRLPRK